MLRRCLTSLALPLDRHGHIRKLADGRRRTPSRRLSPCLGPCLPSHRQHSLPMAEVQQQEGRREGDNGQLGGEASPSRHSDYHGVPLPSPERPAGRLAEAPGGGGKMASAGVQTGAPPPTIAMIGRAGRFQC